MLKKIHGDYDNTPHFTASSNDGSASEGNGIETISKEGSVDRRERIEARKKIAADKKEQQTLQNKASSDTESNSTDYGISHANKIL